MAEFDRRSGIGASAAPAVCGLSPWSTAYAEYCYYVGASEGKPQTEQMGLGNYLEDGIRRALQDRLKVEIVKPETRQHPDIPYLYASPDGVITPEHGVEIKNVGPYHADQWGDDRSTDVPEYVLIQAQHQCAVFGFKLVTVGALLCGNKLNTYTVERDDRVIASLLEIEARFWACVQRREPPDPDWDHRSTPALMQAIYGLEDRVVTLDAEALEWADNYERLKDEKHEAETAADFLKARLLHALGDAATGLLPDGRLVCRKRVKRKGYSVSESEYTTFSIKEPKKARLPR